MDSDPIDISFQGHIPPYQVDIDKIADIAGKTLDVLGLRGFECSIQFTDSQVIQQYNRDYRSKDHATDVLSFPQLDFQSPQLVDQSGFHLEEILAPILGDLMISLPEAYANALSIGHGLDREVCFLIVHGLLHLCGHDHLEEDDEHMMTQQQKLLIKRLSEPEPLWQNCVWVEH